MCIYIQLSSQPDKPASPGCQRRWTFPQWVYGLDRSTPDFMRQVTRRLSAALGAHARDAVIDG
jgi:hypothetical protein